MSIESGTTQKLLNRASHCGKYAVGFGANQIHCSNNNYQDHRQHNCVFSNVLASLIGPELT